MTFWQSRKYMIGPATVTSDDEIRLFLFLEPRISLKKSIKLGDVRINISFLNRGFAI